MPETPRLSNDLLSGIPAGVTTPGYDRTQVKRGVVHMGTGAFHRAHQAPFFEACLEAGDLRWGITGASLRSRAVADQLNPQNGLFTVSVRDANGMHDKVVGAVDKVIVAPEDSGELLEALASPDVHIITLTITEKGYMLDPSTGALMVGHSDVAHDCTGPSDPKTGPGYLAKALEMRRARGCPPVTIISCDNLPHNGQRLRAAVTAVAAGWDQDLADWIDAEVAFPQTMIDRIVPATTPDDIAELRSRAGYHDEGMIKTEPFTQWVIEDHFAGERPDLAAVGVQLTNSVADWEQAKLRLLNGSHSTLAYLGALAGIDYIHQVVARPLVKGLVDGLWNEAEATLTPPADLDVAAYRSELWERFGNPALPHKTRQIAMDGSQKLPQRLLEMIAARYEAGEEPATALLGVTAWMRWVTAGKDDLGEDIFVDDPMAAQFAAIGEAGRSDGDIVRKMLDISEVFPAELAENPRFHSTLTDLLGSLRENGAAKYLGS